MIKIIKEGIKEFNITCPFCYCEFTFEKEDVPNGVVKCPCCGAIVDAKSHTKEVLAIRDNMVWETPEYRKIQNELEKQVKQPLRVECENHCLNCQFFKDYLLAGKIYVGDSPCQWCQYSGLKVTCASTGTSVNGVK